MAARKLLPPSDIDPRVGLARARGVADALHAGLQVLEPDQRLAMLAVSTLLSRVLVDVATEAALDEVLSSLCEGIKFDWQEARK